MIPVLTALLIGAVVGAVFAVFGSVPPAPPTWAGVAGIAGIVAGWQVVGHLLTLKGWR